VDGTASDWAILDFAMPNTGQVPHVASVTYSGPGLDVGSSNRPGGVESGGIQADNRGFGNAIIDASGNVTVVAGPGLSGVYGLLAHSGDRVPSAIVGNGAAKMHQRRGTTLKKRRGPWHPTWVDGEGSSRQPPCWHTIIVNSTNRASCLSGWPPRRAEHGNCDRGIEDHEFRARDQRSRQPTVGY
jgi:hypothetical protein